MTEKGRVRKAGCHRGEVRFRCILVVAAPSREVPFIIGLPTLAIFCRQPGSKSPVRLSSQRGGVNFFAAISQQPARGFVSSVAKFEQGGHLALRRMMSAHTGTGQVARRAGVLTAIGR